METVDERVVRAPARDIFAIVRQVEHWPAYLSHYRSVRFVERAADGSGVVDMSAWRPFGLVRWPTWWRSEMAVDNDRPAIRFRHIGGITAGMDVEWSFTPRPDLSAGAEATLVRILHVWNGPGWPVIGRFAATGIIGPTFVHDIASRTLAGLGAIAEREATQTRATQIPAEGGQHAIPEARQGL